jgi:hypothetical protein
MESLIGSLKKRVRKISAGSMGDEYVVPYWPPNFGAYESDGFSHFFTATAGT